MIIGITERGDPGIDFSWVNKLNENKVDGAILITKLIAKQYFRNTVMGFHKKGFPIIVHATITGFGDSFVEPNVPSPMDSLEGLHKFISEGFPIERLVLRVDPIIPTERGLNTALNILNNCIQGLRMRFSFIDNYKHLVERGMILPWGSFAPPLENQRYAVRELQKYTSYFKIECCAEAKSIIPEAWNIGCVSGIDVDLMGLKLPRDLIYDMAFGPKLNKASIYKGQRKECLCLKIKTELLSQNRQCPNGCLYCYWK